MNRHARVLTVLAALVPIAAPSCGDDAGPACGNGVVDPGEQCDNTTDFCRDCQVWLPPQTTIKWSFNQDAAPGFDTDSCIDLGVSRVRVEIIGRTSTSAEESCSFFQVVLSDLAEGTYVARVSPLDATGMLLTRAPIEKTFRASSGSSIVAVDVPPDSWLREYTGTFYFHTRWARQSCADAVPPVIEQRLTLMRGDTPVSLLSQQGIPMDGSASGPCQPFDPADPQDVLAAPFGHATLRVEGMDQSGTVHFDETFATFIGAGVSNPLLDFDVRSLLPDAGVPDAGVPDAGVPDAGVPDAGV